MNLRHEIRYLAGIPALIVHGNTTGEAGRNGTVLLHHGLHSSKEGARKELDSLASAGFLAVGLDAVGHGERRATDLEARLEREGDPFFHRLVRQTAAETPGVIDALAGLGCDPGRIGMTGISMGGYVTFAATLTDRRLRAIAPILGSPRLGPADPDSPHHRPQDFFPVALLAQNAGRDASVPPGPAREFVRALRPRYATAPDRLAYHEYPHSGHFMEEDEWHLLWARTVEWFRLHL